MSRPRLIEWRGKWYVFWTDPLTGKQMRRSCLRAKAFNDDQRKEFLDSIRREAGLRIGEAAATGVHVAYTTRVSAALDRYRYHLRAKVRAGELAETSRASADRTIVALMSFVGDLRCEQLDGPTLQRFIARHCEGRSPATANKHRRNVKAALRWLDTTRPKLFPDSGIFWPAMKQRRQAHAKGVALTATQIQQAHASLDDGQAYLLRFLACTGCRLGDPLTARLQGRILVMSSKTGAVRYIPLTGAPELEIAPGLLALIRDRGMPPAIDRWQWRKLVRFTPQDLRRNFTSWCASLGVPPAVTAMWQGHSLAVAESFYRQQLLERSQSDSLEHALGF